MVRRCEDPAALQAICDRLGPGTINVPAGVDEALLRQASFTGMEAEDVTANTAAVSGAWPAAPDRHATDLS
jgi:hypothetical protein